MEVNHTPQRLWQQYQKGLAADAAIGLGDTVTRNENFYIGKQWEGVKAPDLDKPVLNFLGRVVGFLVASVTSERIGVRVDLPVFPQSPEKRKNIAILETQIQALWEENDLDALSQQLVRDAAVTGDGCLHCYFDPDAPTGQAEQGAVRCEILSNLDVFFGNRRHGDVQSQPYLLIRTERRLGDLQEEFADRPAIVAALRGDGGSEDADASVTVLTKYFRRDGTIWQYRATKFLTLTPETDLGYRRYPLAWFSWDTVRGSCYGQAAVTALIPNQVAVNKALAMAIKQQRDLAFPKIMYNDAMFPQGWSNRLGAVRVSGDPHLAAAAISPSADVPASTFRMLDTMIGYSKEMMGATDTVLGNVRPDNTSAILALQKAAVVPLTLKQRAFGSFCEAVVRNFLELLATDYGEREVLVTDALGEQAVESFDFSTLREAILRLQIDIGAAAYWSELLQAEQAERLYRNQILTRRSEYLEQLPGGMVKNREQLLARIKREEEAEDALSPLPNRLSADA